MGGVASGIWDTLIYSRQEMYNKCESWQKVSQLRSFWVCWEGRRDRRGVKQTQHLEDWLRTLKYVFVESSRSADSPALSCL